MNCITRRIRMLFLALVLLLALTGCTPQPAAPTAALPGSQAPAFVKELAAIGPRIAGTKAEAQAADWLETQLKAMGYTVTRTPFDFNEDGTLKHSQNIIAEKKGSGTGTVIIGAHYDSVEIGTGADDNASGVAVVLEAAAKLKNTETPQTLKFVFFGAEEVDINGSAEYAGRMTTEELDGTLLMINFDSLTAGDIAYVYGNGDAKGRFRDHVLETARQDGLKLTTQEGQNPTYPAGTTGDWSDHAAFKDKGLPVLYFESTNWSLGEKDGYTQVDPAYGDNGEIWHTQFDTVDYMEKTFPGRIQERLTLFSTVLQQLLTEDLSKL